MVVIWLLCYCNQTIYWMNVCRGRYLFKDETLLVEGANIIELPVGFRWDERLNRYRGPAYLYGEVIYQAASEIEYVDNACEWQVGHS